MAAVGRAWRQSARSKRLHRQGCCWERRGRTAYSRHPRSMTVVDEAAVAAEVGGVAERSEAAQEAVARAAVERAVIGLVTL